MKDRRSIHKYTDQDTPESPLSELLEVATCISSTGNMQLYSVVVICDSANKEKLAPAHFNQPMITGAPMVLTFCVDANRFAKQAEYRETGAGLDNLQTFITSTIDVMLFAQSFCNTVEEKGLDIRYLGATAYNTNQITEAPSLPRPVVPIVTVTVSYPAEPIPAQVERLLLAAVVQNKTYTDFIPASIGASCSKKEALEVNKQFVRENSKETLAQVFTGIRYTEKNNGYFSEVLLKVLKQQGLTK